MNARKVLSLITIWALLLAPVTTPSALAAPDATLNYEAWMDTNGSAKWENTGTADVATTVFDWGLTNVTLQPFVSDTFDTSLITNTYSFNGTSSVGKYEDYNNGAIGANPTTGPATFEMLFKPTDFLGQEILFETGGSGSGLAISLDANILKFKPKTNGANNTAATFDLTTLDAAAQADFIHFVGLVDPSTNTAQIYVNGLLVSTLNATSGINDWGGTDNSGLGSTNGTEAQWGGSGKYYEGDIALYRFYNSYLAPADVVGLYDAIVDLGMVNTQDGFWSDSLTWGGAGVPDSTTSVTVDQGWTVTVGSATPLAVLAREGKSLAIGEANTGIVTIDSTHTLNIAEDILVGDGGVLNINGTVITKALSQTSVGTINLTGNLIVADALDVSGALDLSGAVGLSMETAVVSVNPGGSLVLAAGGITADTLKVLGTGTIDRTIGKDVTVTNLTLTNGATHVFGGVNGTLTLDPSGTVEVSGAATILDNQLQPGLVVNTLKILDGAQVLGDTSATADYILENADLNVPVTGAANVTTSGADLARVVNLNEQVNTTGSLAVQGGATNLNIPTNPANLHTIGGGITVTGGALNVNQEITSTKSLAIDGGSMVINQDVTVIASGLGAINTLDFSRYGIAGNLQSLNFDGAYTIESGRTFTGVGGVLAETPGHQGVVCTWQVRDDIGDNYVPGGDNFEFVWTGSYTADESGEHIFRVAQRTNTNADIDDDGSFYVDINSNGVFESSERILTGGRGNVIADMVAGMTYNVAIGYREGTGGVNFGAWFSKPSDEGAFTTIDPSNAGQAGLWSAGGLVGGTTNVANGTLDINASLTTPYLIVGSAGTVTVDGALDTEFLVVNNGGVVNFNTGSTITHTGGASYVLQAGGQINAAAALGSAGADAINLDISGTYNADAAGSLGQGNASIRNGGIVMVNVDGGADGVGAIAIDQGGLIYFDDATVQTTFPNLVVPAGAGIGGNVTNAAWVAAPPAGPNEVQVEAGSVLAITAGTGPAYGLLGTVFTAGITDPTSAATYTVGDDGVNIYNNLAFGAWTAWPGNDLLESTVNAVGAATTTNIELNGATIGVNANTMLNVPEVVFTGGTVRYDAARGGTGTVVSHTGTVDTSWAPTNVASLDVAGSIAAGQTVNIRNGAVHMQTADGVAVGGTLNLNGGASMSLNTAGNATTGTFNVAGLSDPDGPAIVKINNSGRFGGGATWVFQDGAMILTDVQNYTIGAGGRPNNAIYVLDDNARDDFNTPVFANGGGFYGGGYHGGDLQDTPGTIGAVGTTGDTTIHFGSATGKTLNLNGGGAIDLSYTWDDAGTPTAAVANIAINAAPFSVAGNAQIGKVAATGNVTFNRVTTANDITVHKGGTTQFNQNLTANDLTVPTGRVNLYGNSTLNSIILPVGNGTVRFADSAGDTINLTNVIEVSDGATLEIAGHYAADSAMVAGTLFADPIEILKGGRLHTWYLGSGASRATPKDVKLGMLIRADGDVPGEGREMSILSIEEQGGSGNVLYSDITLEDGAHLGIDRQDVGANEVHLSLLLQGDAIIEREPDEFSLRDITSDGGPRTLFVGRDGNGGTTRLTGLIGDDVTLQSVDSTFTIENGAPASLAATAIIANLGKETPGYAGSNGYINIYDGRDGLGNQLTTGTFLLAGNEQLRVYVDEVTTGNPQVVNTIGSTIRIQDGADARDAQIIVERANNSNVTGMVVFENVVLEDSARIILDSSNGTKYNVLNLDLGDGGAVQLDANMPLAANTIIGNGRIYNSTGAISIDTTLTPGNSVGQIDFENTGGLALLSGAAYNWDVALGASDLVTVDGDLTLEDSWTINVNPTADAAAEPGDMIPLLTFSGALTSSSTPTGDPDVVLIDSDVLNLNGFAASGEVRANTATGQVYLTNLVDATTYYDWVGGGTNQWNSVGVDWDQGSSPTTTSVATINAGNAHVANTGQTAWRTYVNNGGTLTVDAGGALDVTNRINIATGGQVNVSGGLTTVEINSGGLLNVAASGSLTASTVNLTSGVTDVTSGANLNVAQLNIDGGTLTTDGIAPGVAELNLNSGELSISGDVTADVVNLGQGLLRKTGLGAATLASVTETVLDNTNITVDGGHLIVNVPAIAPILNMDVGGPTIPGTFTNVNGVATINGSGADIYGNSDQFHYAYQQMSGDVEMIARVQSIEAANTWTKAGLMIRETLDGDSANTFMAWTPPNGENRMAYQVRATAGAGTVSNHGNGFTAGPYWLKIERVGDTFSGYYALDVNDAPSAWLQLDPVGWNQTYSMDTDYYIGLAITSHTNTALAEAVFDNVSWLGRPQIGDLVMADNTQFTLGGAGAAAFASASMGDTATITGNPTFMGSATAGLNATIDGNVSVVGSYSPTGDSTITGDLEVSGKITPAGTVGGTMSVGGNMMMDAGGAVVWIGGGNKVAVTGALDLSNDWVIELTPPGVVAPATYDLFDYGTLTAETLGAIVAGDFTNVALTPPADSPYSDLINMTTSKVIDNGTGKVQLVIDGTDAAIWDGSTGTDWATAGNWVDSIAPSTTVAAVVDSSAGSTPLLSGAADANTLIIDGASATIATGGALTVANNTHVMDGSTLTVIGSLASTGDTTVYDGGLLDVTGTLTLTGNLNSAGTTTFGGPASALAGAGVLNVTAGTTTLGSDTTVGIGGLNAIGGVLNLEADLSGGTALSVNGGTVNSTALSASNVDVTAGSLTTGGATITGRLNISGGELITSADVTAGTLGLHRGGTLTKIGAGAAALSSTGGAGSLATTGGNLTVAEGALTVNLSAPATVLPASRNVLFVVSDPAVLTADETAIVAQMAARGYDVDDADADGLEVTFIQAMAQAPADFEQKFNVVIGTEELGINQAAYDHLTATYGNTTVPFVTSERALWDGMGVALGAYTDVIDVTSIVIADPSHPIMVGAGYGAATPGDEVAIYGAIGPMAYVNTPDASIGDDATVIATGQIGSIAEGQPVLFVYEQGTRLADNAEIALSKHINYFFDENAQLTVDPLTDPKPWDLFFSTLDYAMTPSASDLPVLGTATIEGGAMLTLAGPGGNTAIFEALEMTGTGTATIDANIIVTEALQPGAGVEGTLNVLNDLTVAGTTSYTWDTLGDLVDVDGALTLADQWTLVLQQAGDAPIGGVRHALFNYGTLDATLDGNILTEVDIDVTVVPAWGPTEDMFIRDDGAGEVYLLIAPTQIWDGSDAAYGAANWVSGLGSTVPLELGKMQVDTGNVNVTAAHTGPDALSIAVNGGSLTVDTGASLSVIRGVDVTGGTLAVEGSLTAADAVSIASGSTLNVNAGTLTASAVNTAGTTNLTNATVNPAVNVTGGVTNIAGTNAATVNVAGGTVTSAGGSVTALQMTSGQVDLTGGSLTVATATLNGGTMDASANSLIVSERVQIGASLDAEVVSVGGETFAVSGADVGASRTMTLTSGEVMINSSNFPGAGLEVMYEFNEISGTTAADLSGNARTGTLGNFAAGDAHWVTGKVGGALQFDGSDDVMTALGYKGIEGTSSRTTAAWIKTSDNEGTVMSWGTDAGGQKWNFRTQNAAGDGAVGGIRTEVSGGWIIGATNVADGQWHHVAMVLNDDGSPNVTEMLVYVDGQLEANTALDEPINTVAGSDFRVGNGHANRRLNGLIDQAGVWSRALDATEILGIWNDGAGIAASTGGVGVVHQPDTNVVFSGNSTLTLDTTAPASLGGVTIAAGVVATIDSGSDLTFTNMTIGGGSRLLSAYATGTGDVSVTVAGTLTGGDSISNVGDIDNDSGEINLTLTSDSTYDFTLAAEDSYIDVNGLITLEAGMTINIDGIAPAGSQDIKLLYTFSDQYDIAGLVSDPDTVTFPDLTGVKNDTPSDTSGINVILPEGWVAGELGWLADEDSTFLVLLDVTASVMGDADHDLDVDEADMTILLAQFGSAYDAARTGDHADFNGDGYVDMADFVILRANWGAGTPAPGATDLPGTTPEPTTMSLLAIGALVALRRRRRKA
jgi:hypothetical protein